jgi:hypothetical protein
MPRRERQKELARRRKRREERRKLRAKGLLAQPSEKASTKESPGEEIKEPLSEG